MQSEILQPFKGRINTVIIDTEAVYCSTNYILNTIENKFGEIYTDEFISELSYAIERVSIKSEDFALSKLERALVNAIEDVEKFEDIEFEYPFIPSNLTKYLAVGRFTKK